RQEPFEAEPVTGQAGERQRRQHGARAGRGGDRHLRLGRGPHQLETGVGYGGHSGVADHQYRLAFLGRAQHCLGAGGLVVLVVADHFGADLDAQPRSQGPQPPGVLGSDEVGLGEQTPQARRGILHVPDRGSCQHDHGPTLTARRQPTYSLPGTEHGTARSTTAPAARCPGETSRPGRSRAVAPAGKMRYFSSISTGAEPITSPFSSRASTVIAPGSPGAWMAVSKPVEVTVVTSDMLSLSSPASRRHCSTSVAPFQLTYTAGVGSSGL